MSSQPTSGLVALKAFQAVKARMGVMAVPLGLAVLTLTSVLALALVMDLVVCSAEADFRTMALRIAAPWAWVDLLIPHTGVDTVRRPRRLLTALSQGASRHLPRHPAFTSTSVCTHISPLHPLLPHPIIQEMATMEGTRIPH